MILTANFAMRLEDLPKVLPLNFKGKQEAWIQAIEKNSIFKKANAVSAFHYLQKNGYCHSGKKKIFYKTKPA